MDRRRELDDMLTGERGASAVLIASTLFLFMGITAVALDVSSAFNERNQNQNAGDNGVMAGGIEMAEPTPDPQSIVTNALAIAQANLTADFPGGANDPDWIAMWRGCVDDGNTSWIALPEPTAWGGGGATLDCISRTTTLLRVRIPDQLVDTSFGAVLGADSITTSAVSIAKTAYALTGAPPVVPFGVNSGAGAGEYCLSSASAGTAYPPCTGAQTGDFGPIESPLFGDFGTHDPVCGGNPLRLFERNLVWGLDHRISPWPHAPLVAPGTPWDQSDIDAKGDEHRDQCTVLDGIAVPTDGIPINSVLTDPGFPDPEMTNALVSDEFFDGRPSRLQQPSTGTPRDLYDKNELWEVDNVGPWEFLTDDLADPVECQKSHYPGLADTDARVAAFEACIANPAAGEVFETTITQSPRFVWAPEYVYGSPPGSKFSPIKEFRPMFLGGVWFNCPNPNSGQPCGIVWFPDATVTTPLCDGTFPSCKNIGVDQVSSWLLPDGSLPTSVYDDFDTFFDNKEAELFQ